MSEPQLLPVMETALKERRISRQDWESILDLATREEVVVFNGEKELLERLVTLLEGGNIGVEGMTHREVLSGLAVFA